MSKRDNRLSELRNERKLSQTFVGDTLCISQTRVSAYERGENIPSDVLKLFADFYGVSTDYILRLTDEKNARIEIRLNASEHLLVNFYRRLPYDGKKVIDGMVCGYGGADRKF